MAVVAWDRRNVLAATSVAAVGVLCGVPLLLLLTETLLNIGASLSVQAHGALLRSVLLAGTAALLATLSGAVIAFQLERVSPRWRGVWIALLALPLFLPSYIHALGWSTLVSSARWLDRSAIPAENLAGWVLSVWVLTVSYGPIATLALVSALRRWDRRFTHAAWSHGLPPSSEARLRIRYLIAPAGAASLVIFLLAFADFAVPDFFQVQTYATEIFVRVSGYLDTASAIGLSLPVLAISAAAFLLLMRASSRLSLHASYGTRGDTSAPHEGERSKGTASLVLLVAAAVVLLPIAQLVRMVDDVSVMVTAFRMIASEIVTSYAIASGVAALIVLVALSASYVSTRRIAPAGPWLRVLPAVLFALPASLLGLLAIRLWNQSGALGWAYDVGAVLAIALLARWLPLGMEVLGYAWRQVGVAQENAAMASGIGWGTTVRRVLLPQIWPAAMTVFVLALVVVFNELTLVTLLAPPGFSTVPLRIFQTVHYGPQTLLAAISVWQVLLLLVPVALLFAVARRSYGRALGMGTC